MLKKVAFRKIPPTKHTELRDNMVYVAKSGDKEAIAAYLSVLGSEPGIAEILMSDEDLYNTGFFPLLKALNGKKAGLSDELSEIIFGKRV